MGQDFSWETSAVVNVRRNLFMDVGSLSISWGSTHNVALCWSHHANQTHAIEFSLRYLHCSNVGRNPSLTFPPPKKFKKSRAHEWCICFLSMTLSQSIRPSNSPDVWRTKCVKTLTSYIYINIYIISFSWLSRLLLCMESQVSQTVRWHPFAGRWFCSTLLFGVSGRWRWRQGATAE